jgi:excisionase family DNA binding protein
MVEERERLESVEEASKRLGVSSFTGRRLIKTKHIKAVRVSRRVLVPDSQVSRVIAEGCGKSSRNL